MDVMKITVLQHSLDTPVGTLSDWAQTKGHELDVRHLYAGAALPPLSQVEWLVILGGPMNVDEHDQHPWLVKEKEFIKQAVDDRRICLGICLGGQLLARILGASVKRHTHWEIGWHPIDFETGERLYMFQWHQDTFDIPEGARRIATNKVTANQAFVFGDHVVGLQFHPEATDEWVRECMEEAPYPTGPFVQPPALLREGLIHRPPMTAWFFRLLDEMEAKARAQGSQK